MSVSDAVSPGAPPSHAGDPTEHPTSVRYAVLGAACILAVLTYLLRVGFSAVSTELRTDVGLSQSHLGYLTAAFMIAYGLLEVPWGSIGDRLGVRGPLVLVALGGALTTGAVALVSVLPGSVSLTLAVLLVLRFLFGAFQAGTFPLISRMIADWMPTAERGQAQGLIWMSSRLGGSLAPFLLIPLFQALGNWQSPLLIVMGIALLWPLAFWPLFPGHPEDSSRVNAAERALIASGRATRSVTSHHDTPWGRMLRSRSVWCLCLMYGGIGYSGNFFLFFLKDYLATQRGLSPGQVKWLMAMPFVFGVGACLVGGAVSDAIIRRTGNRLWSRRVVGMAGLSLAAVTIVATLSVQNVWWLGALLCITFFGNDLSMGPAWAAAADKGGRYTGALSGLMNMTASFTGAAAMVIAGWLFDRGYDSLPFLLFGLSYAAGALAWLGVNVTHTLDNGDPGPISGGQSEAV
jgi:ACS family glucarate transporter-like MFS transporter